MKRLIAILLILVFSLGVCTGARIQQALNKPYIDSLKGQVEWNAKAYQAERDYWFLRVQELEYQYGHWR